jgi:hypothetical protein
MDQQDDKKINMTVLRSSCGDDDTCETFSVIDTDPEGGYVIGKVVTDPAIVAAHAHKIGPGEALFRVPRSLAPEVFGT